ncbi:glycoside hydrolase family 71 protein [Gelatoporia subvermispora B]|uniref:Glycoside hydrolase family 71 protein n=1 Tax=Ceriporiopsis subvermispora (strain B) TaxID=914234 RepID=M2PTF1_CERS8|nr:glycoside hydrolase family 71 protein [Gelatoporia subvermispora B]
MKKRDNPKFVFAHHMVGNTYPYTVDNWASDIALAQSSGIDGFALNVGSDVWQPARVQDAYTAAANSSTDFKLFLSFDMSALPCSSPDDAQTLRNYITSYSSHPNQFIVDGRVFASTFSGESCTFGQDSVPDGWKSQFTQHPDLTGANAVYFVPSFFIDPSTFNQYQGVMDGDFNWNSGWNVGLTPDQLNSALNSVGSGLGSLTGAITSSITQAVSGLVGTMDSDNQHLQALSSVSSSLSYMAAASPWFFTHYGANSYNKNWIYLADFFLYPTRWENLISNRNSVDFVECISWNDYGESHYLGPIEGAQPNSQAWVDGFDHTGWLDMTNYYATAFKTGSYPNITQDKLYMWARPHPTNANSPDPVPKPTNFQLDQDTLWAVVFATAPATVTLATADSTSQDFFVPAGVTKLSLQLTPGGYMQGTISRNGNTVVDLKPDNYTFNPNPPTYNYNAFVAFASS